MYQQGKCLHNLFEAQVEQVPTATAVVFQGASVTYRELDEYANHVAQHLKSKGVGPEVRVGICIERSIEMIVGILGILKAGGAYVPMDPAYPQNRLSLIAENADIKLILVTASTSHLWQQDQRKYTLLDIEKLPAKRRTPDNFQNQSREYCASHPAYILFTSGSTGVPKGVVVEHRSVLAMLFAFEATAPVGDRGRIGISVCSFGFDVSVWEIFSCLCFGGALHILTPDTFALVDRFAEYMGNNQITSAYIPPNLLSPLADVFEKQEQHIVLSRILVGVEPIQQRLLQRFRNQFTSLQIINGYGPTEATICSTFYTFETAVAPHEKTPIGKNLLNYQVYIVDENLKLVPELVAGEIVIGGAGLARGYMNQPRYTAERFIPNPFSSEPGARLYKTGDMAQYLPDGNIEFLGRADHQVKLRGFRIELGEIESVLAQHPNVKKAVVLLSENGAREKQLVAYVAFDGFLDTLSISLRSFLHSRLPAHMIPSVFVLLNQLPVTAHGKLDRQALSQLDIDHLNQQATYVEPQTPIELELEHIWCEVLGLEKIGRYDNFFECGGHSLKAVQIISRVQTRWQLALSLHDLLDQPTICSFAEVIELNLEQMSVAPAHTGSQESMKMSPIEPIRPRTQNESIPLSFSQQQLWFLDELYPNQPLYNITARLHLKGPLDKSILEDSLTVLINRHEALRTTFVNKGGRPYQVVSNTNHTAQIELLDLQHLPESTRLETGIQVADEAAQQPFDLFQDPLLRTILVCIKPDEHFLILVIHHIISDGWSMNVLVRELDLVYHNILNDNINSLPDLPIQYADVALWQQKQMKLINAQLDYWRQNLLNVPTLLLLPTDRPRPPVPTFQGARYYVTIPATLATSLKAFSQQQRCTLFVTLLTAFNILLNRYTNQADILVGTPNANRNRTEIEGLIGYFTNTLVIRTNMTPNDLTFIELLSQVRQRTIDALKHQDVPFEKLVEVTITDRDLSYNPLVQVVFALQNVPQPVFENRDLAMTFYDVHNGTAKFDLTLELWELSDELSGWFEYNTDLFDETTIARMSEHFLTLLNGALNKPDQIISKLPILTQAEKQQILLNWNETQHDFEVGSYVPQLFEVCVDLYPDRVAVVSDDQPLTYQALNKRANQLAHTLQAMGVGPETRVAVCLPHSSEMIVGLLGILKTGGAYVPLDPAYPAARIDFMLKDSGALILVTCETLLADLLVEGVHAICLDRDWPDINQADQSNPPAQVTADNLAYLIYTSGSTGQPKGVAISHAGLLNLIKWHQETYNITSASRATVIAGQAFDASVWEIWPYLTAGACLHIPDYETRLTPSKLMHWLVNQEITISFLPTPLAETVLSLNWPEETKLEYLLTGGDKLHRYPSSALPFKLVNHYGPTENSVVTTFGLVTPQAEVSCPPAIGKPIANVQVYLLDANLQPVPIGVPGEIYIGGAGLARGYFNRPGITAEHYIPNPFSKRPGERLYKTGDLARYFPDGRIDFIGRIDHQIKIRGFRIELGEIETVLSNHPTVNKVLVLDWDDTYGRKHLVAYIVPTKVAIVSEKQLQSLLSQKLPDYMIPAVYIFVENIPITPNGKIDRQKLPAPDRQFLKQLHHLIPPETALQHTLATIMKEVLALEDIGIYNNFFAMGGHSLLAAQVISRIYEKLKIKISLQSFFESPTIASLEETILRLQEMPQNDTGKNDPIQRLERSEDDRILSNIDELTPEEIDAMLAKLQTD